MWKIGSILILTFLDKEEQLITLIQNFLKNKNDYILKGAQTFLDTVSPWMENLNSYCGIDTKYGKVEIQWPQLSMGGSLETKEKPDKNKVVLVGELCIEASPLIGIEFSVDILTWAIRIAGNVAAPGSGEVLVYIKDLMEKGVESRFFSAKVSAKLMLTADGRIDGKLLAFPSHDELEESDLDLIVSGSAMRPLPYNPLASSPSSASIRIFP